MRPFATIVRFAPENSVAAIGDGKYAGVEQVSCLEMMAPMRLGKLDRGRR